MATLTGKLVSETYKALLKMIDNDILTESEKQISDGFGQGTGIFIDDNGFIRASIFKVTGGSSSQFLKADGSLDSNSYLTDAGVLTTPLTGFVSTEGTVTAADTVLSAFNKIWWNIENGGGGGGGYVPYTGATQNLNLGTFGLISDFIQFNLTPTSIPTTAGTMAWNNTDGTVDLKLKGGNVTLQLGQEQVVRVVNKTGANLTEAAYKVVRVRNESEGGSQGQRLAVLLAQADSKVNHTGILGIVTENIANNQEGFVTSFGEVRKIDTTGDLQEETWADGDALWLSETVAGQLTNIEPETHPVQIGYVLYAHQNNGKIYVYLSEGVDELTELHDVEITDPEDEDVLFYDGVESLWINKNIYSAINATDVGKSLLGILNAEETIPETTKPRGIRINVDNSVDALEVGTQGYLPFYDETDFYIDSPAWTDGTQVVIGDDSAFATGNKLSVVGNLAVDQAFGYFLGANRILFRNNTTGELRFGTTVANDFTTFYAGSVEKGRLTSSGFLGLGLTNPESMIHAKASSAYPKIIIDNNSQSGGGLFSAWQNGIETALFGVSGAWNSDGTSDAAIVATGSEQGIRFYTNGTNTVKMGINFEGNVFVGALPSFVAGATQLIVSGFAGAGYLGVNHYDMSIKGSINTFNSVFQVGTSTFHSVAVIVENVERARINSSGRMLLGTQTDNTVDKLQVNGSLIATAIKKTGGTSLQFLKADGSVDNNVYYLDSNPYSFISLTELSSVATGLTYTNFTGVFSLTDGYVIPTIAETENWDEAYTNRITFAYAPLLIENNDISISKANTTTDGYLSSTDWNTFNNKSNTTGTVTSVSATVPTGFAISGSPITTSGTLGITFAAGYSLPTTAKQTEWDTAFNDKINSASVTGTTTKTLTLTQQDGGTITASWTDINTDAVLSVFGRTGAVVAASGDYTTAQVTESGNLYFTDARSRAALSFAAGSGAYNSSTGVITIPTNNNQITNGAGYITGITSGMVISALGYTPVPNTRTLTINGTAFDLSADRSWTIAGTIGGLTTNTVPKATSATTLGNSNITDTGSLITLGSNTNITNTLLVGDGTQLANFNATITVRKGVALAAIDLKSLRTSGNIGGLRFFDSTDTLKSEINSEVDGSIVFYNNNTERFRILSTGNSNFSGSLGIGTTSLTGINLRVSANITGATTPIAIQANGVVQSDAITNARYFSTNVSTSVASFTLANLNHYETNQSTFGAGSTVTNQAGFFANSSLIGGLNNYGFLGQIPSGTNRWNLYMGGTANNYLAGNLLIGSTTDAGFKLDVTGTARISGVTTLSNLAGTGSRIVVADANGVLSASAALTGYITGSGTTNTVPKFTGASAIGNSNITDNGTSVSIGGAGNVNINNLISGSFSRTLPAGNTFSGQTININGSADGYGLVNRNTWNFLDDAFTQGGMTMYDNRAIITRSTTASNGYVNYQSIITNNGTASQSANGIVSVSSGTGNFTTFIALKIGSFGPPNNTNSYTNYIGLDMNHTPNNNVTNYYGVNINDFTGTSLSRGINLNLAAGTNKWNIYAGGTANNFMAGSLGIGTTSLTGINLRVSSNITGATSAIAIQANGVVQSDANVNVRYFSTNVSTSAASFTISNLNHYESNQSTFGAGSIVSNQAGFLVGSSLIGGLNNYGFRGLIPAGTNRWNIYMDGTANNYMAGSLGIGITAPTSALHIDRGTATASYLQFTAGTTTGQLVTDGFDIGIDASGNGIINQQENLPLMMLTNNTERLRITSSGNVAIGTTTDAGFRLDVNGTARVSGALVVGDGTQSPSFNTALLIRKGTDFGGLDFKSARTSGNIGGIRFYDSTDALKSQISTEVDGTITFVNNSVERLRVASSGNLLIGTTTDSASSLLTLQSTTKGFLPPRMTAAQRTAIASPAEGLIVVQTDGTNGLYIYIGAAWHALTML